MSESDDETVSVIYPDTPSTPGDTKKKVESVLRKKKTTENNKSVGSSSHGSSSNTSSATSVGSSSKDPSSNSGSMIMANELSAIKDQFKELISAVSSLNAKVNKLESKDEDGAEDEEDYFDPEVIDPLVWLKQSFSKLRSAYKVSSNIKDNELLSVISAEALKDNTAPDFKRRIQYLLVKYKDTLCRLNGDLKLDAISSKGYAKLVELVHIKSDLLEFALTPPIDLVVLFEITELCYGISQVEKVFLDEGLHRSDFNVATDFANMFVTTNRFAASTEKERQALRNDYAIYRKANNVKGITKQKKWKKSYSSNGKRFENKGDSKEKFHNRSFQKDKDK